MMMVDMTRESMQENPKAWGNGIVSPRMYEEMCDIIEKHCGFGE